MNPTGNIPMLTHDETKVISDGEAIFSYLVNTNEQVRAKFFHEN